MVDAGRLGDRKRRCLARNADIKFSKLFEKLGAKDEDAEARIELLLALQKVCGALEFTSAEVKAKLDEAAEASTGPGASPEDPDIATIRAACSPRGRGNVTARSIGTALTKNIDAPYAAEHGTILLSSTDPSANNAHVRRFSISYKAIDPN